MASNVENHLIYIQRPFFSIVYYFMIFNLPDIDRCFKIPLRGTPVSESMEPCLLNTVCE